MTTESGFAAEAFFLSAFSRRFFLSEGDRPDFLVPDAFEREACFGSGVLEQPENRHETKRQIRILNKVSTSKRMTTKIGLNDFSSNYRGWYSEWSSN